MQYPASFLEGQGMSCILRLRRMGEGPLRELFEINCQFQKGDCPRFLRPRQGS